MRKIARRVLPLLLAVAVGCFALLIFGLSLQVDDWSRDLSTNHAAKSVEMQEPVDTAAAHVKHAASSLPHWELIEEKDIELGKQLHFVRTTPWLRFKDDITVRAISTVDGRSVVHAESRSRIGKGDLGQNPRNLVELMDRLESPHVE